jgi:23S rRNA pseudouridine1911/1915/1917 synthase
MVKVSSSDVIAILRRFEIANDDNTPRNVEQLTITHPSEKNTLASFRFKKHLCAILFDGAAEDNIVYITDQIHIARPDLVGSVIPNPQDSTMTYGMPYKGKDVYLFINANSKQRLDTWLAERNPDLSRSTWQKHIDAGHIVVNGEVQTSSKYMISEQDAVIINIPDMPNFKDKELPIVYMDENVIVINKPAGVLSHSKGALSEEFTVADFFARYSSYHSDTNRPGIIHRLDRDTSGVMIGARNDKTADLLQKQFANRKVKKTYLAVVDGTPKEQTARIDLPIGRNPSAPSTFRVDAKGKPAQTNYKALASDNSRSLLELRPETGRTHQLRVHLEYIGTPIIGDKVYGKPKPSGRMFLHAYKLEVTIPEGNRQVFEVPPPADFLEGFGKVELG